MATSTVSAESVIVDEGAGYAEFVVRLSGPSAETLSVGYRTLSGSANPIDYNAVNSTLGFAPGETVKSVRVGLSDDTVVEGNETFYLELFKPANASANLAIGTGTVTATILDNDGAAGMPVLKVSSLVIDEISGVAVFVISLDRLSTSPVNVNYATEAGTAGTADFEAARGTAVFASGERVKTVRVPVIDDGLAEGNEQFDLVLSNPVGAFLLDPRGTASIGPSDQPLLATSTVSAESVIVDEGAGYAEFVVRLSGPSAETLSVGYRTLSGSANPIDYNAVNSTLGFAPGETVKSVRVGLSDDTVVEGNETFYLELFKPANASANLAIGTGTVTATILDNDGVPLNANVLPVIMAASTSQQSLVTDAVAEADAWWTASDADGDAISWWAVYDDNPDASSASFSVAGRVWSYEQNSYIDGFVIPARERIAVTAQQFADLSIHAGSAATTDPLYAIAWDGQAWGNWAKIDLATVFKRTIAVDPDGDPLFDSVYYYSLNPDVAAAAVDASTHYASCGWREGRDPNPYFDTDWYLTRNPDVAAAGINPLEHYRQWGWREGRDPGMYFDSDWYLTRNPDVAAAGINPLQHYIDGGWREGRDPHPAFDTGAYLALNPDVAAAGVDPLVHYLIYGYAEGREATSVASWEA